MIREDSHLAFEYSLRAMESGEDLESCLRRYPDFAEELRPALEAAQAARLLSDDYVPNAALHRSRTRLLTKAAGLRSRRPVRRWFGRYPRLALFAGLLAVIFYLSWQGLITVSAKALPGDPLYLVKLTGENLSLRFAPGSDSRRTMSAQFERRRVDEVQKLLGLGRVVNVLFIGILEVQQPEQWKVDGIDVRVDLNTKITGEIITGMVVQVAGQTQPGGWVQGSTISLHSYQFIGLVENISRTEWNISGVKLAVGRNSQIDPAIRLGDLAIVLVQVNEDQSLRARAILRMLAHTGVPSILNAASDKKAPVLPPLASEVEFTGIVEEIKQDLWKIGGRDVVISGTTDIVGTIFLGDSVKVHALAGSDGSLIAREIEVLINSEGNDQPGEETGGPGGGGEASGPGSSDGSGTEDGGEDINAPYEGGSEDGSNQDGGGNDGGAKDGDANDSDGEQDDDGGGKGDGGDQDGEGGNSGEDGNEGDEDPLDEDEGEGNGDEGDDASY